MARRHIELHGVDPAGAPAAEGDVVAHGTGGEQARGVISEFRVRIQAFCAGRGVQSVGLAGIFVYRARGVGLPYLKTHGGVRRTAHPILEIERLIEVIGRIIRVRRVPRLAVSIDRLAGQAGDLHAARRRHSVDRLIIHGVVVVLQHQFFIAFTIHIVIGQIVRALLQIAEVNILCLILQRGRASVLTAQRQGDHLRLDRRIVIILGVILIQCLGVVPARVERNIDISFPIFVLHRSIAVNIEARLIAVLLRCGHDGNRVRTRPICGGDGRFDLSQYRKLAAFSGPLQPSQIKCADSLRNHIVRSPIAIYEARHIAIVAAAVRHAPAERIQIRFALSAVVTVVIIEQQRRIL